MGPDRPSLQEEYAPRSTCFGCGPANAGGLHVRSFEAGDGSLVAEWTASPEHEAFPGVLNGGIIGALLDCHANWAAAMHLMRERGLDRVPATVTAEYQVRLRRPARTDRPLRLRSHVLSSEGDRVRAEATLSSGDEVAATFQGTFVAVPEGHPGYHRWDRGSVRISPSRPTPPRAARGAPR